MSVTTSPITQFRQELVSMTPEFANALPSHIKPEKFQRVVMTVVQLQPDLLKSDRRSLFAACLKCAADGLIPDGREAALVVFSGKVQYFPMFTGIQKRVRNSGEIASIQAHVIYENDEFTWTQGSEASIQHRPKFPGDRGKAVGAYAIAKFKDGSDPQVEVMDWATVERIRNVSKSASSGPWAAWPEEMARKSVFRRLAKWLPLDAESDALFRRDDEAGAPTVSEPSGAILDGETIEADEFEQASRGVATNREVITEDGEILTAADALIAEFAKLETLTDITAQEANAAIRAQAAKLSKPDQEKVRLAIEAMKQEKRAAA